MCPFILKYKAKYNNMAIIIVIIMNEKENPLMNRININPTVIICFFCVDFVFNIYQVRTCTLHLCSGSMAVQIVVH